MILKHISCGIYPSQWQKHLGNGSVCMYFQEINLFCLFLGNFPPVLMCLWGFLSFGPKMAPNMYCAISTLPNNKTPERWPTSEHVMSLPGNFWPLLRFLLFFVFWGKNYPENTYCEVSTLSDDKHLRDWLFICTFNDRFEKGKEDKVQALFLYWECEYWEIEICEFASFNCILFVLTQKHAWYPPDSWCKTRFKWSLGIINWVLYFNK